MDLSHRTRRRQSLEKCQSRRSFTLGRRICGSVLSVLCIAASIVVAQDTSHISDGQIDTISARMAESARQSWELGTRAHAILELNVTRYSVFTSTSGSSLPPPHDVPSDMQDGSTPYFEMARDILADWNGTANGPPQPLMPDGSAADPASNGITFLLANWTGYGLPDSVDEGVDYGLAAKSQLDYLYSDNVPKTSDGAMSHRNDQLQLWSDFVYMVPPFLAYYGVLSENKTMLVDAYTQCRLYRGYLRDTRTGLWRHVLLGQSGNDPGFWSTGNGWAAAGMLRVYATIKNSQYANSMANEMQDLERWVEEIHQAMFSHLDNTHLFGNYADRPISSNGNFYDASSTALVAATVFRASLEWSNKRYSYLEDAQRAWDTLFKTNNAAQQDGGDSDFSGYAHFTRDGWLTPVVNPSSYGQEGSESPEGQAFVVMLYAARRDWEEANRGNGGGLSRLYVNDAFVMLSVVVGLALLMS